MVFIITIKYINFPRDYPTPWAFHDIARCDYIVTNIEGQLSCLPITSPVSIVTDPIAVI